MHVPLTIQALKSSRRKTLRARRRQLSRENPNPNLEPFFRDLLHGRSRDSIIAGYSPIGEELNIWPLLRTLQSEGCRVALPVVMESEQPLEFREWTPDCEMETDTYGIAYPVSGEALTPNLILLPLLAFTARGDRLGYGGGYYDRTLAALRENGEIFACGVAYAGQEEAELPTDAHDAKLDGILTENGFKAFA